MNAITDILLPLLVGLGGFYLLRKHWPVQPTRPGTLELSSAGPVGAQVAEAVAKRLERGDMLAYSHRDYCGVGLRYADGEYIYGDVSDGQLPSTQELQRWLAVPVRMERRTFENRDVFVAWLSEQTDHSLYGEDLQPEWLVGNQRLTIGRLVAFANGRPVPATG